MSNTTTTTTPAKGHNMPPSGKELLAKALLAQFNGAEQAENARGAIANSIDLVVAEAQDDSRKPFQPMSQLAQKTERKEKDIIMSNLRKHVGLDVTNKAAKELPPADFNKLQRNKQALQRGFDLLCSIYLLNAEHAKQGKPNIRWDDEAGTYIVPFRHIASEVLISYDDNDAPLPMSQHAMKYMDAKTDPAGTGERRVSRAPYWLTLKGEADGGKRVPVTYDVINAAAKRLRMVRQGTSDKPSNGQPGQAIVDRILTGVKALTETDSIKGPVDALGDGMQPGTPLYRLLTYIANHHKGELQAALNRVGYKLDKLPDAKPGQPHAGTEQAKQAVLARKEADKPATPVKAKALTAKPATRRAKG